MKASQTPPPERIAIQPVMAPLVESPASWMRDGDSPAEIILAVAVLVSALTGLLKVWFDSRR